jgi:hypothetical protein
MGRSMNWVRLAAFVAAVAARPALAAGLLDQPAAPALPKAPYNMKCYLDRDLVVNEELGARPVFKDGQWHGRIWNPESRQPGPELTVQPGANATCVIKQNEK